MTDTIAKNARNEDGTEWNVFEKDQGKEQWPDVPSYTVSPAFDVTCDQASCGFNVVSGAVEGLA